MITNRINWIDELKGFILILVCCLTSGCIKSPCARIFFAL